MKKTRVNSKYCHCESYKKGKVLKQPPAIIYH